MAIPRLTNKDILRPASDGHSPAPAGDDNHRRLNDPGSLAKSFLDHVRFSRGKSNENATPYDRFLALALTVRDQLSERWVQTQRTYYAQDVKRAYYLSAEYLLGRALSNNLMNMGL